MSTTTFTDVRATRLQQQDLDALAAAGYNRVPVVREVLADFETPLSTYLKLAGGVYTYLFESVQGGEKWGRFSIIGLACNTVLRVRENTVAVEVNGSVVEQHEMSDPFVFVESFKQRYKVAELGGVPKFSGRSVCYFSYDSVCYVESVLGESPGTDTICTPVILLLLSVDVVVFDNLLGTISIVCHAYPAQPG